MVNRMLLYPFKATFKEITKSPDSYIASIFSNLESEFLVMPKGLGFIDYPVFERGYEALKAATNGFEKLETQAILPIIESKPISAVVIRTILGFTPPEWAYIATQKTQVTISQGFIRSLDRKIRFAPERPLKLSEDSKQKVEALLKTACSILLSDVPNVGEDWLHRLDKADTKRGLTSIKNLASIGVPYAMLLYERLLGRPFAGHRDSVSELVGDNLETAIEVILSSAGISFRKTKRAEHIEGFDQCPDFIIPSEFNPQAVIEAKITEDDGTARDKVTRIQHLSEISLAGRTTIKPKFEVIACIGGRGFGVRREDMKKMLLATRGKIFTPKTLSFLIEYTRLKEYVTKPKNY